MPQMCETRAGEARASRNSCGGWFRDPLSPRTLQSQHVPSLIARHLGSAWVSRWGATLGDGGSTSQ
jgi:hypothetical protein